MALWKILLLFLSFRVLGPGQLKNKEDKLRKYLPILEIPKRSFFPYISFRSPPKLISFPSDAVSQTWEDCWLRFVPVSVQKRGHLLSKSGFLLVFETRFVSNEICSSSGHLLDRKAVSLHAKLDLFSKSGFSSTLPNEISFSECLLYHQSHTLKILEQKWKTVSDLHFIRPLSISEVMMLLYQPALRSLSLHQFCLTYGQRVIAPSCPAVLNVFVVKAPEHFCKIPDHEMSLVLIDPHLKWDKTQGFEISC